MLHVLPPNVTTAEDLREHLHRAHLERLERMRARAVEPSLPKVARVPKRFIYTVPVAPAFEPKVYEPVTATFVQPLPPVAANAAFMNVSVPIGPRSKAKRIIRECCERFGVTEIDLKSPKRKAPLVRVRQIAIWRMSKELMWSLPRIGQYMGGRDHTTILHAIRRVNAMIEREEWTP